jgi:RNA polymerase sigma factor (sigma-70 family)
LDNPNKSYSQYYFAARKKLRKWKCTGIAFDDIYHEAFIILLEKQGSPDTKIRDPETYITQVCKFLWFKEQRKMDLHEGMEKIDPDDYPNEVADDSRLVLLLKHMKNLPSTCQEVLTLYAQGYSEEKISDIMKLGGAKAVKNRKYYCKEKLRNMIMNDPLFEEIYG